MTQPGGRVRRVWRSAAVRSCLVVATVVLVPLGLVWWLDPAVATSPGVLLWRNALPVALLAMLVLALSGRALVTMLLTSGLLIAVFRVNAIKQLNMNEPLLPGDLVLRHQLANNLEFFGRYLGHSALPWVAAVLGLLAFIGLWYLERSTRLAFVLRLIGSLVALLGMVALFHGTGPLRVAYSDQRMPAFPLWHPIEGVRRDGLMAGLVRLTQEARVTIPKADGALVRGFAEKHASHLATRGQRPLPAELPDIVVVQSEAFFAPSVLKQIDAGGFAPNFARLSTQGISGYLTTPTYGGGTIRTEFETLTGYPMDAFPSVAYPYYGLANSSIPTVPRRLARWGYETRLFHPFKGSFWNRNHIMPLLGFQSTDYLESFEGAKHAGYYVADDALFDHVLADLEQHTEHPQFAMAITMENHGPWHSDVGEFADILDGKPLPKDLSKEAQQELTHYLSHLANGDQALGRFVASLMARPRWTVLLFYGDHLPALPHAFAEIGFDNGRPGTEQNTRYMLLSNRPLDARSVDLNAYDLPGLLFDTVGLPEDGVLAIEAEARQILVREQARNDAQYSQVIFNAAQLEASCRKSLTLRGTCPGKTVAGSRSQGSFAGTAGAD